MPTSSIHLIVAKKLANKYKNLDNYNFYLGCIAPDSVNVSGFAPKEERWNAHLRDKDLNIWKHNIITYYNEEHYKYNSLFIKGYITHIMTDIIYDELFYKSVIDKIKESGIREEDAHKYMLNEMNIYGSTNRDFLYVKDVLKNNNITYDIRNITKEVMTLWKEKIINEEFSNYKSSFITDELLDYIVIEVERKLNRYQIL